MKKGHKKGALPFVCNAFNADQSNRTLLTEINEVVDHSGLETIDNLVEIHVIEDPAYHVAVDDLA
ncbi:MAG: hypothetical protein L3J26_11295 [Candidatus Polarisedimenticolaceae bacterium]|nr:hypothetical protein [Candidatus Polarisedimenticolaceae bacterium]